MPRTIFGHEAAAVDNSAPEKAEGRWTEVLECCHGGCPGYGLACNEESMDLAEEMQKQEQKCVRESKSSQWSMMETNRVTDQGRAGVQTR